MRADPKNRCLRQSIILQKDDREFGDNDNTYTFQHIENRIEIRSNQESSLPFVLRQISVGNRGAQYGIDLVQSGQQSTRMD